MTPQQLLALIRRWALPVVLLAALGAGVAYGVSRTIRPLYTTNGSILVVAPSQQTLISLSPDEITATYAALALQSPVFDAVAADLHGSRTSMQIASEVTAVPRINTLIIDLSATDPDPRIAAQIVNRVMQDYAQQVGDQNTKRLESSTRAIDDEVTRLTDQLASLRSELTVAQKTKLDTAPLSQQIFTAEQLLNQAQTSQAAQRAQLVQSLNSLQVVSPAVVPTLPSSPHNTTNTLLGAFAGLLLGVGLAVLLQYLDQGLQTPEAVKARLDLPTLAVIPRFRVGQENRGNRRGAPDQAAEAYRRLRINLRFASIDKPFRSVVVTSGRMNEGKSHTSANLAGVLGASGEQVLLIDADMRRPSLHRLFGRPIDDGLSELLLAGNRSESLNLNGHHATSHENLTVLTSGTLPPNPSELLSSSRSGAVLHALEGRYDIVIIDTPPIDVVTDALSLAGESSATILVIEPRRTNARQAQRTIESLRAVGANVVGVVLNKASVRAGADYYYAYSYSQTTVVKDGKLSDVGLNAWKPITGPAPRVPAKR